jgi:CIC family chloride channel protein
MAIFRQRLPKLLIMASLIGATAGVVAWLFRLLIGLIHNLAFYGALSPHYEANMHSEPSHWGWLWILVPAIGGTVVVWLVRTFAPQAKGHGVPEVIDAIHYGGGNIPGKVAMVKALASALTIGTGGALGREGPIVQIGAALSSALGQWLDLPARQKVVLIACGASAGIAATFNAPLAGLLFSIELLLVSVNSRTILPVALATGIAAWIGRVLMGPEPAFNVPSLHQGIGEPREFVELLLMVPFGALMGMAAWAFTKAIYASEDFFDARFANPYVRHWVGALSLGILAWSLLQLTGHYYVQGVGYATIVDVLTRQLESPWFLLALVALKALATCLTIGSGGSGGVFSPSLFLGASLGGAFGHLVAGAFPALGVDPIAFAIVGMAALVAAATSAPLTAAVITYEMTLDYNVVLPTLIGVSVAYAVRRSLSKVDIYTTKLMRRGHIIPEGLSSDIVGTIQVQHILNPHVRVMEADKSFDPFDGVTLVTEDDRIIGLVMPFNRPIEFDVRARDLMYSQFALLPPQLSLMEAMRAMHAQGADRAVVVRDNNPTPDAVLGVLTEADIQNLLEKAAELHVGHNDD